MAKLSAIFQFLHYAHCGRLTQRRRTIGKPLFFPRSLGLQTGYIWLNLFLPQHKGYLQNSLHHLSR